jgi:Fe-S-cluster containining protein
MMENKNYLNIKLCKECGGACCKRLPGAAFPKDFGEKSLLENLVKAFKRNKWAIDWWEGDPTGKNKLEKAYYIRPKIKGADNLFDPTFGGECIFLNNKGCELPPEERPLSCKLLEPKPKGKNCIHHLGNEKQKAALTWLPFTDMILEAARKVGYEDK